MREEEVCVPLPQAARRIQRLIALHSKVMMSPSVLGPSGWRAFLCVYDRTPKTCTDPRKKRLPYSVTEPNSAKFSVQFLEAS